MSTHNVGFNDDLSKIIFELSSNIIKYAPYFFFWKLTLRPNLGTKFLKDIKTSVATIIR